MVTPATIEDVLQTAERVDARKLQALRERLQSALGGSCAEYLLGDPMIIRRMLTEHLRSGGASEGTVQSYEQLYMGIIRRAALKGIIPPPPEGPWTLRWQSVLTTSNDFKAVKQEMRAFAAWATSRGIEPENVTNHAVEQWSRTLLYRVDISRIDSVLAEHFRRTSVPDVSSVLTERLKKKALRGSVRTIEEVYGKQGNGRQQESNR